MSGDEYCVSGNKMSKNLPIFVINLDSATSRYFAFERQAMLRKREFIRWSATPGKELDSSKFGVQELSDGIFVTGFREWSKNEAACGISHIKLLQKMVAEEIPWIVVLEDDARIKYPIPDTIEEFNLPHDAEIVLLNSRSQGGGNCVSGGFYSYEDVVGGAGTDGYLISLSGAKKMLKILYPLNEPLDFQMYSHFRSVQEHDSSPFYWKLPQNIKARDILLNAYKIKPSLVDHADILSTIGGQRHPRARYYCRVLLNLNFPELNNYYTTLTSSIETLDTIQKKKRNVEYLGVDVSHLDDTIKYYGVNKECVYESPMQILNHYGINIVRISIWVDEYSNMNLNRAMKLARMAFNAGLKTYLVLHYSDSWADPIHQSKPSSWVGLTYDELKEKVYKYTMYVIDSMMMQGTPPEIIQVGNEITNGFLWPSVGESKYCGGNLYEGDVESWRNFAILMGFATRAIRDAGRKYGIDIKIMLHIDKGAKPEVALWWFDKARMYQIDYDIIGLSYYYLWHYTSIKELSRLSCLEITFPDKYIMMAETSYPYRQVDGISKTPLYDNPCYTLSGQYEYIRAIRNYMKGFSNGCGFCWWGAFFINDRYDCIRDVYLSQALFDEHGVALESINAFKEK